MLHDRCAYALSKIIADVDRASTTKEPESLVIMSHAAPIIAMGRALTGRMPESVNEVDFHTYTCSISRYRRRVVPDGEGFQVLEWEQGKNVPKLDWRNGKGVGGGWNCEVNAGTEHLSDGAQRDWYVVIFSTVRSCTCCIPALDMRKLISSVLIQEFFWRRGIC